MMIDFEVARDSSLTDKRRPAPAGWPERGVLAGSLLVVVSAILWWVRPQSYPFGPHDRFADLSLMSYVPTGAAPGLALTAGVVGVVLAGLLLTHQVTTAGARVVAIIVASVSATLFGFLVPDIQVLILSTYLLTLAVPAFLVAVLTNRLVGRRPTFPTGTAANCAAAAGAVTFAALLVGLLYIARDAQSLGLRPLVVLGSLILGLGWGVVLLRLVRHHRNKCQYCGRPGPGWTSPAAAASWGRVVTWAAALCPLPYVVSRLTWLTPWPFAISAEALAANPGLRIFGLALLLASEAGTWLTLGLIRPRGEMFPQWLPFLGGRPVPVMAAVWPGMLVALMMCIAGHSAVQQAFRPGTGLRDHLLVLLIPFPVWGPLLAAATLAYWYRRRPACRYSGTPRPGSQPLSEPAMLAIRTAEADYAHTAHQQLSQLDALPK
jgi:hypothetical protein